MHWCELLVFLFMTIVGEPTLFKPVATHLTENRVDIRVDFLRSFSDKTVGCTYSVALAGIYDL